MIPSSVGATLIKRFEQFRPDAYRPTPTDPPTIGWGTTGPDIVMGMHWTLAQANARFDSDLAKFAQGVTDAIGSAPTTQNEFDALVSFAYNVGVHALEGSTLLGLHLAGDFTAAADQFRFWRTAKHVVLRGLVRRRAAEAALYRT